MKPGTKLRSTVCDTSVVVVRPAGEVVVECGGQPMIDAAAPAEGVGQPAAGLSDGTQVGKRYEDQDTGLEVLCVKAGVGTLTVGGRPLTLKSAKPLPSSD
ncbi:hypothetical protein G6038_25080 [Rhodococcus sp. 14C212]|uniref:hypothetical protein n=1 Tax=Rhodococcus sp. 14C212 TaxID=2711209 RepID=UPI0013EDC8FE|nr:hypothetical protein [Rhodococcus sp. 14C212]NGP08684.1 hypothetical protein [Rhodococcus sp. 14C212]